MFNSLSIGVKPRGLIPTARCVQAVPLYPWLVENNHSLWTSFGDRPNRKKGAAIGVNTILVTAAVAEKPAWRETNPQHYF